MEKAKEIELLKQLKGDTYFADTFSAATIDKMCENIKNDFPIMLDTEYETKQSEEVDSLKTQINVLSAQLEEQKAKSENELDNMNEAAKMHMEELGRNIVENIEDSYELYKVLEEEFGIDFIIKTKHDRGIELDEEEIDYLISKI